jgi:predicted DNA-binding transcriptional regulator YafY
VLQLNNAADAEPFINRVTHAIARKAPMTVTYRKLDGEVTVRTIEPYAIDMTADGHPIIRALDRVDGTPKTWRMERVMFYSVHRSARLLQHAY